MKLNDAIAEIGKIRTDLLFGDDLDKSNDESLGDILFIKALASLETAVQDLKLCKRQYQVESTV